MSAAGAKALKELETLGHARILSQPDGARERRGARRLILPALGRRRLESWAAARGARLRALLSLLDAARDAEDLAVRGRVRRLLGDAAGARADLARAAKSWAPARAWLGELDGVAAPAAALKEFARAAAQGFASPEAALWTAAAELELVRPARGLAALEGTEGHAARLLRAAALTALRRDAEALRELEAAAADDPGSSAAFVLLGRAAAARDDAAAAEDAYHRVREIESELRGEFLFEDLGVRPDWDDPDRAVGDLTAALARRPDSVPLLVQRAELLRHPRLCRYDEATADYRRAAGLAPERGWVLAHLARALNHERQDRAGLEEFDRAAALSPRAGWIRAWRGAALARVRDAKRAEADFDAAAELMPWYPFSYAWRGALRRRARRPKEAAADLDVALALDPSYAFSWNERFQARLESGDAAGAASDLRAAHALDPKYTWAAVRGERALAELDAAAAKSPKDPLIRFWRGHALLLAGKKGPAAADLAAAEKGLPSDALAAAWHGRALAACGQTASAARRMEKAARLDPSSWGARKALADVYAAEGKWDKALPQLRAAAAMAPTTVSLLMDLAGAAARLGREDEALAAVGKALGLDPRYAEARLLKARVLVARAGKRQAKGDFAGQAEDFKAALAAAPELFPAAERERLSALLRGPSPTPTRAPSRARRRG